MHSRAKRPLFSNQLKFGGDILNWVTFWEQFEIAIHSNKKLHDVQKLAYLRDAVEAGPAKHVINGLH